MNTTHQETDQSISQDKSIDQDKSHDISEVTKAANNADVAAIKRNLNQTEVVGTPSSLTAEQKTPFIDETVRTDKKVLINDPAINKPLNPKDSYRGRKYDPKIDGPQQASQETDEVYSDPRKEENLPAGGKNVADLNAYDLSLKGNK